jgi:hypothetical protein
VALGLASRVRFGFYLSVYLLWILLIFYATGGIHAAGQSWLAGWQQWDAHWYEQIWREGYPATDPRTLVFPPGYPVIVGIISKLFHASFLATAVVLNLAAFFCTAVLVSEWLSRKFVVSSFSLFVFVLSAPAAYFAFTAYSDVIFMLLLWVLLWIALTTPDTRGGRALIAQSVLLLVLPWIRLTGYALASWLFARRVVALAVLASLALWLEFGFMPLFYLCALAAAAVWLAKRREGLLALSVLSILLVSYNQGFWRSVVRYDLPVVPVLCLPLLVTAKSETGMMSYISRAAFFALIFGQFTLQIYFARVFHTGGWAF